MSTDERAWPWKWLPGMRTTDGWRLYLAKDGVTIIGTGEGENRGYTADWLSYVGPRPATEPDLDDITTLGAVLLGVLVPLGWAVDN